MNKKTKEIIYIVTILILIGAVSYMLFNPKVKVVTKQPEIVKQPVFVKIPLPTRRVPEFRQPPIRKYKPGYNHQIGVLVGPNEEIFPLYGKESKYNRDRYNYYTTTSGNNLYPIPITYKNRNCMNRLACNELYDGEKVKILGKSDEYTVNTYTTDNFF